MDAHAPNRISIIPKKNCPRFYQDWYTFYSNFRLLSPYKIVCLGLLTFAFILGLTACSTKKLNEIDLMPAPDVYEEGAVDPFTDTNPIEKIPYQGILYATDRSPAGEKDHFYKNKRGNLLRLGSAKIKAGQKTPPGRKHGEFLC